MVDMKRGRMLLVWWKEYPAENRVENLYLVKTIPASRSVTQELVLPEISVLNPAPGAGAVNIPALNPVILGFVLIQSVLLRYTHKLESFLFISEELIFSRLNSAQKIKNCYNLYLNVDPTHPQDIPDY